MDNAQFHVEKDMIWITGELDETAYVYQIDISKGYEQPMLTNKLTIPCNYVGVGLFAHSYMKDG